MLKSNRKKPQCGSRLILLSLFTFLFFFLLVFSYLTLSPFSFFPLSSKSHFPDKFLWYAPHSGFGNQLFEFKNAILIAAILNRTLVVPPVLDHHAVALGSCPKFRVTGPNEIRISVWDHAIELIRSGRYVSMAEIIDISSLVSSSLLRAVDFRDFLSLMCGVETDFACFNESKGQSSLSDTLNKCGSLLSGLDGNVDKFLYAVNEDCRTTVWTYQSADGDGMLDAFQVDEQLKKKKKISYVRRRQDIYKVLGPGTKADLATVMAFGSLFTAPYKGSQLYIDFHGASGDQRFQSLKGKIEFLPFAPEIVSAGSEFAETIIKAPFLCAQLRLLDGQFKNHWKSTFSGLKQKLESFSAKSPLPIHIFLMTDLPETNWTHTYLGDLVRDSHQYKLFHIKEEDFMVREAAKKLNRKRCNSQRLPDVLLYIEETICSCASLGFVGTAGSTIAESIEVMRKFNLCSDQKLLAL